MTNHAGDANLQKNRTRTCLSRGCPHPCQATQLAASSMTWCFHPFRTPLLSEARFYCTNPRMGGRMIRPMDVFAFRFGSLAHGSAAPERTDRCAGSAGSGRTFGLTSRDGWARAMGLFNHVGRRFHGFSRVFMTLLGSTREGIQSPRQISLR